MWLFSVIYVIQYVIPNVLTQYLQGLMLRLSLTQMGLRSGLNVEFVSQRPAMKVQNKLWALLFHQLCPLPFNFRNQLKKKKKKDFQLSIFNPKLSRKEVFTTHWTFLGTDANLPFSAPSCSAGSHELHGRQRCRAVPFLLPEWPGIAWGECRDPGSVPASAVCFFVPFLPQKGETQLESSAETSSSVVLVTSKGVSSRKSFSGHFPNTFIWWQISCKKSLLWNSLISFSFSDVWKEE